MEREVDAPEKITGLEVLAFAEKSLADYDFETHSDADNVWFSYHYSHWLAEVFSRGGYGVMASEVKGSVMPSALKSMIKNNWKDTTYYLDNNWLYLEESNEFDYVPPVIPHWQELNDSKTSFIDILKTIESEPEILDGIQTPWVYCEGGVRVAFEHGYSNDGFGLEFILKPNIINVLPFGSRGETSTVTDFVVGHKDHMRLLAKTAAELSLSAVSQQDYSESADVHPDRINQLERRLAKIEIIGFAQMNDFRQPSGLKELVIEKLSEKGLLPKQNEQK